MDRAPELIQHNQNCEINATYLRTDAIFTVHPSGQGTMQGLLEGLSAAFLGAGHFASIGLSSAGRKGESGLSSRLAGLSSIFSPCSWDLSPGFCSNSVLAYSYKLVYSESMKQTVSCLLKDRDPFFELPALPSQFFHLLIKVIHQRRLDGNQSVATKHSSCVPTFSPRIL